MARAAAQEDFLAERQRAEDILLGALGFAEEAHIISVSRAAVGYRGVGQYTGGERFEFQSEEELSEVEEWALGVFLKSGGSSSPSGNQ